MSTENNNIVEPVTEDLELFSAEFFGQKEAQSEPTNSEEAEEEEPENDAQEEDTHSEVEDEEVETDEEDVLDDSEEDETEEDVPSEVKPKKNRFQERINELNGKFREQERRAQDLEAKLSEAIQKLNEQNKEPEKVEAVDSGPTPADLNEDGTEKYPLGEFDPNFIRDLTKFDLKQEMAAIRKAEEDKRQQQEISEAQEALQKTWSEKLGPAKERYPDFQDKGENLFSTFESIDQGYGEYLASAIMNLDHGPDVLYYLANHTDEAKKIVDSGAMNATGALYVINAKFAEAEEEKQRSRPKVSKAPDPPQHIAKGNVVAKIDVPDDTDDLEAFANKFFEKKRRR